MPPRVKHRLNTWRYLGVAGFFLLAMAATWGLQTWRVSHVAATAQEQQEAVVADVLVDIEQQFNDIQRDLLARAEALAEDPVIVQALRTRLLGNARQSPHTLVRYFADIDLPQRTAIELYDPAQQLVVWSGFSLPIDEAPQRPRFEETMQTAIAEDADWRQGLVVWYPVRDGVRVLGAVRVMELVYARTPIRNQYLRNYRLGDTWQRQTGLSVSVTFEQPLTDEMPVEGQARYLQGLDGTILGRVSVTPPTPERLVEATRIRYGDVLAFWATLLMGWLMAGLWFWYRAADRGTKQRGSLHAGSRFAMVALAWWGLRYTLLALNVPARWQTGKAPFSPLFDPSHLASTLGNGLMRSTGDIFITAVFTLLFAVAFLGFAARFRHAGPPIAAGERGAAVRQWRPASRVRFFVGVAVGVVLAFGLILVLAVITRQAVLDSTLDFFSREGLFPKSLVLLIFCTLLLLTLAVIVFLTGLTWMVMRPAPQATMHAEEGGRVVLGALLAAAVPLVGIYTLFEVQAVVPWQIAMAFLVVGLGAGVWFFFRPGSYLDLFTLRSVLAAILLMSLLLYPLFYSGLDTQRRQRMQDAAESFVEVRDPKVMFALQQVLQAAQQDPTVAPALADTAHFERQHIYLDSLATVLLRGSLLASLGAYDVSLLFIDARDRPVGRYDAAGQSFDRTVLNQVNDEQFDILQQMYAERGTGGVMVEQMTGRLASDRFQYAGVVQIAAPDQGGRIGWVMARAEQHSMSQEGSTPFLRVLLPTGYSDLYANLSLAEFRDGVLLRSSGRDFGRYRLDESVQRDLVTAPEVWHTEVVKERQFVTYYRRDRAEPASTLVLSPVEQKVVAVRVPAINTFDHLYYLLRLTVAGLLIGLFFYGLGLYLRRRAGRLPAPRIRFRDKVLNAFLVVGLIAVTSVGFVGISVVTGENERAVQSWLRRHLERVEETLALEAQGDEMPYRVLERVRIDSLAARVGLDLNIYDNGRLVRTSRPQLQRERLIDTRLPIPAYQALYLEGYQFTYVEEELGTFTYTAGYRALLDEQGQPAYVLSVPTLPEQERIEEERARTVAYLFGALLLLVVVVMATASLIANALARPIARLRVGLEDVARGRFERKLPVGSRDEVGELVQTFNGMQEQLAESRRQLAQQERQLAWREMARQVAHEIKNPLTPMKLSVQHLRRAYQDEEEAQAPSEGSNGRFSRLFESVTGTLVEQIDTLARIANEFSTFARMPTRVLERLDLNEVIREAVALMQAEAETEIEMHLAADPLILEADHEELRRVYINLIKNALQALPDAIEDKDAGRITVATEQQEGGEAGFAYSTVTDTGSGIPVDLRDKIFEPNFSTKTSGTGLGLAIVRKSIEERGGEIGFETEEGTGTTFWIRLPLVR